MKPKRIQECGCCEAGTSPTPEEIKNRPGLSTISYRVGTFASFRQAMIEDIYRTPELRDWTARWSDDYGIALIEMWAYLADILTFYQERIANEAFLRTALHRETVMRLAAMIDYKLNPGVAATAFLAFFAEKNEKVNIPIGLRVQSVPGQDEKPQKFETVEMVEADTSHNDIRIYPQPVSYNPFDNGNKGILDTELAEDITNALFIGDEVVIFKDGVSGVEEKQVEALETIENRTVLTWSPSIKFSISGAQMFKWVQKFRLFGYNAPNRYLISTIVSNEVIWEERDTPFTVSPGETLNLDSIYDHLKVGTSVLISHSSFTLLSQVTEIGQVADEKGPLSGTVTQITLADSVPEIDDLRAVTIYELVTPEITFLNWKYPDTIIGDTVYVPLSDLEGMEPERTLILDDEKKEPQIVTVTDVASVDTDNDGESDHLAITFSPPLCRPLNTLTARFYGNIAKATHGETVSEEILGNGEASVVFQEFSLGKSPATFVPSPKAPTGTINTLEVRIGSVLWTEAESLYGYGSKDQVYITRVDDEGKMTVRFGNGETGARLPTGRNNVVAEYRRGLGSQGNVRENSLTTLLDRPLGLKSVFNPKAAEGGTDPESMQKARTNAPNTVRTFARAISLHDYEDLARGYTGIAKARAARVYNNENEIIQLTIAGEKGQTIEPASTNYENFTSFLEMHRDTNHPLEVIPHSNRYLILKAVVQVNRAYKEEDVLSSAKSALIKYFSFDNLQLGQGIHLSDLYAELQAVDGVTAALITKFDYKLPGFSSLKKHLIIEPNQIAALLEKDLEIKIGFDLVS